MAKAITLVESTRPADRQKAKELLRLLSDRTGNAVRVGISGVPGAGKSTFIDAMGRRLIAQGHKIAVLAVDPSSTKTGGSILGDRTRMGELAAEENVFIRPSPSAGHLGGVARATRETMLVLEAAGYDVVLVETVGVGQSEVAVSGMVDTFLLITLARAGDQLQGIKRGILEMADVITVNKADGDHEAEARVAARDLASAMRLIFSDPHARRPPVLTSSSLTGKGLDDVWAAILEHREYVDAHGGLAARRHEQQREWMWAMVEQTVLDGVHRSPSMRAIRERVEKAVGRGDLPALEGAEQLLDAFVADVPTLLGRGPAAEDAERRTD